MAKSDNDDPNDVQLLAWDDGPSWQLEVQVQKQESSPESWRLSARIKRGEQFRPLNEIRLALPNGLIVLPDSVSRLAPAGDVSVLNALATKGAIDIPINQGDELVQELWQWPTVPQLALPAELQWEQVLVEPRPQVRISPPERKYLRDLGASVHFDYDGRLIRCGVPGLGLVDPKNRCVVARDPNRERQRVDELLNLGFRLPLRPGTSDFELNPKKLPRAVRELVRLGWQVEAHGKLLRRPGEVRMSISSSIDWFDLEAIVDFEGQSVALPKLLAAMRRGDEFVTLDDGTQGMLPDEWLRRYGVLAQLGEAEGDKLRFVPSQAAILDALLATQPQVQFDQRFDEMRRRLSTFQGVQPSDPPESFQGQLRDYQSIGLGWLKFLAEFGFGGCLADDMGLGKTVQVLAMLAGRRTRPSAGQSRGNKPSLVVVPRSLVFNWIEEARRFTPALRVRNYTGFDRQQVLDDLANCDLLLTTYGTLRRDVLKFQEVEFDYAILDEAQAVKNPGSQAAKACKLIRADHRLAMSGTPIENHLGELWSLFEFLNPGMLGRSSSLKLLANGKGHADAGELDGRPLLAQAMRPFILRRTKQQVLTELPEKTEQTLYCELDEQQRTLYNELRDHYRASLNRRIEETGLSKSKMHVLEALLRLRQAACHPGLLDQARKDESSAKLETLLEQLSEVIAEGHKALVFSQFTSLLAIVRAQLDERGVKYEYLDGATRNRQERVERFQSDEQCPLFLISLKAGGQGLNLTAADYVFILDPWWNPAVEAQAVDRAHRIGQERPVFAYRLIARDTVEEKILELQGSKRQLAEAIISEDNSVISNLTADDLRLLLS
jgi:superfamily II DNA or RNA helicase